MIVAFDTCILNWPRWSVTNKDSVPENSRHLSINWVDVYMDTVI